MYLDVNDERKSEMNCITDKVRFMTDRVPFMTHIALYKSMQRDYLLIRL
jgi:hypothetical protein